MINGRRGTVASKGGGTGLTAVAWASKVTLSEEEAILKP